MDTVSFLGVIASISITLFKYLYYPHNNTFKGNHSEAKGFHFKPFGPRLFLCNVFVIYCIALSTVKPLI